MELFREESDFRRYASWEELEDKLLGRKNYEVKPQKIKKDKPLRCKLGIHKMDKPGYAEQTCLLCGDKQTDYSVSSFPPNGLLS